MHVHPTGRPHRCWLQVDPADVIIVEGILVLHMEELRAHCNMLVYVDTGAAHMCRLTVRVQTCSKFNTTPM
jgi:uridine kinase